MLSAVIIVVREVLEAAILVSALLVLSNHFYRQRFWLHIGLAVGIATAAITAWYSYEISELFDGIGQELQNAASLVLIALLLLVQHAFISANNSRSAVAVHTETTPMSTLLAYLGIITVALAVQRECAEIVVYIAGFAGDASRMLPVLTGSTIGAAIGVSIGILLYYGLQALSKRLSVCIVRTVLALTAAGMVSQAVLYLAQAGLIDAGFPLWDSSHLIAESSLPGQFLYAALGYESTPSTLQVGCYFGTLAAFVGTALYFKSSVNAQQPHSNETTSY